MTISRSAFRDACFSRIANHDAYIRSIASNDQPASSDDILRNGGIIHFEKNEERLLNAALTAHVAICCELLDGLNIPLSLLTQETAQPLMDRVFDRFENLEEDLATRDTLEFKLHSIDAFRTMQILRGMGLFLRPTGNINQLSLGAGSAKKDIRSIHLTPALIAGPNNSITFSTIEENARHIVIIDGDPSRSAAYAQMNNNDALPVFAINNDAIAALTELPQIQRKHGLALRNTVIGLRIDHRMIPDAEVFFEKLSDSIEETADLIITIGSGFDLDDFTGRVTVMQELHDHLKSAGLLPALIKLHGRGSIEEQRNSPSFGLRHITTYQILYCRLERDKLTRHRNLQRQRNQTPIQGP